MPGFRLSPQQRRLWSLRELDQTSSVRRESPYRVSCTVIVEGRIDIAILKAALRNVVQRHEILRTAFVVLGDPNMPLQVIASEPALRFHEHDLSELNLTTPDECIRAIACCEHCRPLDIGQGPPLCVSIAKLSSTNHLLFITLPALCSDIPALKNLVSEISSSYGACLDGGVLSGTSTFAAWSPLTKECM